MFLEIILSVLLILIFFIINAHEWPPMRTRKLMRKIPGPPGVPFFGLSPLIARTQQQDLLNFFGKLCEEYGPVFKFWSIGIPSVVLTDPEEIEVILSSTVHLKKGPAYDKIRCWLNDGLLLSTGSKWQKRRKLLTPSFHFKILEGCLPMFNRNSQNLKQILLETNGKEIDVYEYIAQTALEIICEAAMGISLKTISGGDQYGQATKTIREIIARRLKSPWFARDWFYNLSPLGREQKKCLQFLHTFAEEVIEKRRNALKNCDKGTQEKQKQGKKDPKTFLDCLIELDNQNPGLMSSTDIRAEVDTFMFAGQDTTSLLITSTLFLIGHHPDIQEKIFEELDEIFGDSERDATMEDIHHLSYLERVVKESSRLLPSAPVLTRRLQEDLYLPKSKCLIPSMANVIFFPYWLHRDPKYYPDPDRFDPDRFLPDEVRKRHPFSHLPFSAGPRNCIGQKFAMMEIKVLLSSLLRSIKVESVTSKDTKMTTELLLRPAVPLKVKIIKRH